MEPAQDIQERRAHDKVATGRQQQHARSNDSIVQGHGSSAGGSGLMDGTTGPAAEGLSVRGVKNSYSTTSPYSSSRPPPPPSSAIGSYPFHHPSSTAMTGLMPTPPAPFAPHYRQHHSRHHHHAPYGGGAGPYHPTHGHPLAMPGGYPPNALHVLHEQRRRQRLKRETVLASFDSLTVAPITGTVGGPHQYMVTRTLPPYPFWENLQLLQSNPAILHFLRDFGRCDWMDVDTTLFTVRMSCSSLDQLRLTDEVLVMWLRFYDPMLPFWTLFATISMYSGFMVGKLVGHLRNIEVTTGAKVWVAPRDPESTYVSFFICAKSEDSTMMAYHALQSREMAALALGEKVGTSSEGGEAQEEVEEEEVEEVKEGGPTGGDDDDNEDNGVKGEEDEDEKATACKNASVGGTGGGQPSVGGGTMMMVEDDLANLAISCGEEGEERAEDVGGPLSSSSSPSPVKKGGAAGGAAKKNEEGNNEEGEEEARRQRVAHGDVNINNNNQPPSANKGAGQKRRHRRRGPQEQQQSGAAERGGSAPVSNNKEPRGA